MNDAQRLRYHGDQFFLKTAAEMAEIFKDYPEALANTMRIAERVNVEIPGGQNHLPKFDVPEGFTLDGYFEHVTRAGLRRARASGCGSWTTRASCVTRSATTSSGWPTRSR